MSCLKKYKKKITVRTNFVITVIFFVAALLLVNLFYIQVQNGPKLREIADNQYVSSTSNLFERGNIYFLDKDGQKITAAGQKIGYKIALNPSLMSAEAITKTIDLIAEEKQDSLGYWEMRLNKKNLKYLELFNRVDKDKVDFYKQELGKDALAFAEKWRSYPLGALAAHGIGFMAYRGDSYEGRYGLESYYNDVLERNSEAVYKNFFARIFHDAQDIASGEFVSEGDIVSSIDPRIQSFIEHEINQIQDSWNSDLTGVIVLEPSTGEIRAMASSNSFDLNNFKEFSNSYFKNPSVSNVYEFGSIMKPLIVAMGLDQGKINANTSYYDEGSVVVEDYVINNFDKKGRGWINTQDILNQSLNTGMVFITKKIGKNTMKKYFNEIGFTEPSGVDLPNDATPLSSNLKSTRLIEFANMSFGQGIAMSPLSMVKALTSISNYGLMTQPHLVKSIEYTNGFQEDLEFESKQIFKEESAEEITKMLVNVYDNYSKGKHSFENYSVAAKTGTAQIADPKGGYYSDRNLHSFFGYFPAYEPRYLVYLYTVHPKGARYASETLIPPFKSITQKIINYYNIAPDR